MLNGLDLFSGYGGLSLALSEWVRPIAYCENERYAQGILLSRIEDGRLPEAPIWDDVRTLDGTQFQESVDIIYGGFPCQDISVAGTGKGMDGERSGLFREIVRLAQEIEPTFLFLENVPAIRTRGLDAVIEQLTAAGYDLRWLSLSAAQVGANHKRERWFLLANSGSRRCDRSSDWQMEQSRRAETKCAGDSVAESAGEGFQGSLRQSRVFDDGSGSTQGEGYKQTDSSLGRGHAQSASDVAHTETSGRSEKYEINRGSDTRVRSEKRPSGSDIRGVNLSDSDRLELRNLKQREPRRLANRVSNQGNTEFRDDGEKKPMADSDCHGSHDTEIRYGPSIESRSHTAGEDGRSESERRSPDIRSRETSRSDARDMADSDQVGLEVCETEYGSIRETSVEYLSPSWWAIEPNVGRVVDGHPSRVDRVKSCGNGVVPLQAKTAFEILMGLRL